MTKVRTLIGVMVSVGLLVGAEIAAAASESG